ncbi:NAD(P)/FAD-dependent oxidoreductase [Sneathiella chinensis]|uniref:NAD/FAD-binding protein n=1 Tax=Sneathiella chinensis TaxID=349750 RepID=A0ABQ5U2G9_9PROT|nr:FAD-dependent oxidoreductase [Sneathiella chinensis]GLQ05938.1 NAD/FAD-binding protein [Sneathiella chinensis]
MKDVAVIGSGISGLSAAWLLSLNHRVTLFEKDDRLGGHSNTTTVDGNNVDTGFIVYNDTNYPNLVALFDHLGILTQPSDMSFSVSRDEGALEYAGHSLGGMFVQKRNLFRPSYLGMMKDILRFYREAPMLAADPEKSAMTLGDYLHAGGYGRTFIQDHILPMGAAIWSTPAQEMLEFPAVSFIRFCENHGLLRLKDRPRWRTVTGGSQQYVSRISDFLGDGVRLNSAVSKVRPDRKGVLIECRNGYSARFDEVVIATHANQALSLLETPDTLHRKLLGAFRYAKNLAILHTDPSLMPRRRAAWSSWNYLARTDAAAPDTNLCVTYWMNRLHDLTGPKDYFVTLNPIHAPAEGTVLRSFPYEHPVFDPQAMEAQRLLWSLQGQNKLWFCGSYFGYGFHEDGLQSGLAVAEALGGALRPWQTRPHQSRICLPDNYVETKLSKVG